MSTPILDAKIFIPQNILFKFTMVTLP